ncbi:MAG: hypothetical protein HY246_21295 [Proteobacteria bacterium]|nr:hypothetical protein [Pseudomonadota bacterium]
MFEVVTAWFNRRASFLLAASSVGGLLWPGLASAFRPLLAPVVFGLVVTMVLSLDWRHVIRHAMAPGRPALVVVWVMIGSPLVIWLVLRLIDLPPGLERALVLMASSPSLTAVPAWALVIGLDAPLALVVMIGATLLQPFIQPPIALGLLGIEVDIGLLPWMARLGAFLGGAFLGAALLRWRLGAERLRQAAATVNGLTIIMLIVFVIGVMDGVAATLRERPLHVLLFVAAAFAANFSLQATTALLFRRLGYYQALTAALAAGNRNIAIVVASLGASADPDLYLYLACGQFPMYVTPMLLGPLYRRLVARTP